MKEIVSSVKGIISKPHLTKIIFIVCMIIIFWQLNSIKTDLKAVRQGTTGIDLTESDMSSKKHIINYLDRDVRELKSSVSDLESDVKHIELKVSNLESNVTELRGDIRQIKMGF